MILSGEFVYSHCNCFSECEGEAKTCESALAGFKVKVLTYNFKFTNNMFKNKVPVVHFVN